METIKVKLPRKRKKAFIKAKGKNNYVAFTILGEVLTEDGVVNGERYYDYVRCRPTRENPKGVKITKRW